MKKYIVSEQQPNGDFYVTQPLRVKEGDFTVASYKALLTQTDAITGTELADFTGALIPGERYTIITYEAGDDFSNIAEVIDGNINESGCFFKATGEFPYSWSNGSQLQSQGSLVVHVIESQLDYSIEWIRRSTGIYNAYNNDTYIKKRSYRSFPRGKVMINVNRLAIQGPPPFPNIDFFGYVTSIDELDDSIDLIVYDRNLETTVNNSLYYTPVEILIKQEVSSVYVDYTVTLDKSSFPLSGPGIAVKSGLDSGSAVVIEELDCVNSSVVNNLNELIDRLNNDDITNRLGIFSSVGETIQLSSPNSIKEQFSPDGNIFFEVLKDA